MSKYEALSTTPNAPHRRIANANTTHNNNTGRGNGRGRGRGGRIQGRGGRGRGRGRTGRGYHSNQSIVTPYGPFQPEAKVYPMHVYRNFTIEQKQAIGALKRALGWTDNNTPPNGFVIDHNTGYPIPNNNMAPQTRAFLPQPASINHIQMQPGTVMLPPPPPTLAPAHTTPPIPQVIQTPNNTSNAGASFGRSGRRNANSGDSASIASVSINGSIYNGRVFDANGNPLN